MISVEDASPGEAAVLPEVPACLLENRVYGSKTRLGVIMTSGKSFSQHWNTTKRTICHMRAILEIYGIEFFDNLVQWIHKGLK